MEGLETAEVLDAPLTTALRSIPSCLYYRVQMFEAPAGVRGPERPADAGLGHVVGLSPRGVLRIDRGRRRPARG